MGQLFNARMRCSCHRHGRRSFHKVATVAGGKAKRSIEVSVAGQAVFSTFEVGVKVLQERPNFTRSPLASIAPWEISLALSLQGRGKDGRIQLYLMPSVNFADVRASCLKLEETTVAIGGRSFPAAFRMKEEMTLLTFRAAFGRATPAEVAEALQRNETIKRTKGRYQEIRGETRKALKPAEVSRPKPEDWAHFLRSSGRAKAKEDRACCPKLREKLYQAANRLAKILGACEHLPRKQQQRGSWDSAGESEAVVPGNVNLVHAASACRRPTCICALDTWKTAPLQLEDGAQGDSQNGTGNGKADLAFPETPMSLH
ncbi:hypothetical protein AK812_SmicGene5349 [Symbiodinium microadriaticum]|uniref:Uncharacterized protein n=1 Tax=Symbiodinium microadriaticum TaxID=2951 RepID=A0A1Q9ETZ5_SYMMI|nr:hypothetical protein AK812_SmicGene5349 [Symbiodinium microadriaticum]